MSNEERTISQPESEQVLENGDEEDQEELLKGDAIGETLFSESWVIKTLMKLTEEMPKYSLSNREPNNGDEDEILPMELDEALETDLCLLWDMAADKDVAICLMKHDIITLIKCVIDDSIAPRLTEIAVGILGNLSCQQVIGREIVTNTDLMSGLVNLLSNNDTQTVVQCVRLLEVLLHSLDSCDSVIMNHPSLWERISFILQNSLNEDLLCGTLKLLNYFILQLDNDVECPCEVVLQGILECQNQLRKDANSEVEFPNNILEAFDSLISSLYNLSRRESMRSEIGGKTEETSQFLEFYLSNILRRIQDNSSQYQSSEFTSLTASAVEAVTLFYIVIDTMLCAQLLSLSARIGYALSGCEKNDQTDQYVADYGEMLGDCFRKLLACFDAERILQMLEPFDVRDLNYLFQHASRATPEGLDELIAKGRSFQSFNKVTETYNSFTSSVNAH